MNDFTRALFGGTPEKYANTYDEERKVYVDKDGNIVPGPYRTPGLMSRAANPQQAATLLGANQAWINAPALAQRQQDIDLQMGAEKAALMRNEFPGGEGLSDTQLALGTGGNFTFQNLGNASQARGENKLGVPITKATTAADVAEGEGIIAKNFTESAKDKGAELKQKAKTALASAIGLEPLLLANSIKSAEKEKEFDIPSSTVRAQDALNRARTTEAEDQTALAPWLKAAQMSEAKVRAALSGVSENAIPMQAATAQQNIATGLMQSVNAGVNQRDVIPATLSRDATLAQGGAASAPYEAQTGLNRALIANALSPYGPASPETTGNISYLNPNTGKVEFRPGNIPSAANAEAEMYRNLPGIGKKMTATGPDGKEIPTPGPRPDAVVTPIAFGAQQPTVSIAPSSSKKKATTIAKKAATIIAPELKVAFEKKEKADKELAQRDLIGKIQTERDNLNTAINTSTTQFTPYGAPSGVPISLEYRNAQILKSRKLIADLEAELKKIRK